MIQKQLIGSKIINPSEICLFTCYSLMLRKKPKKAKINSGLTLTHRLPLLSTMYMCKHQEMISPLIDQPQPFPTGHGQTHKISRYDE